MKSTLFVLLGCSIVSISSAADPKPYTPQRFEHIYPASDKPIEVPAGSDVHKELFWLLQTGVQRLAEEKKLKVSAFRFEGSLRAFNNWAVFSGKALDDRGDEVRFDPDARPENRCEALFLRTRANGWVLVDVFAGDPGEFNHALRFERFSVPGPLMPHLKDLTKLSGVYTFNPSDTDESAAVTLKFRRNPDKQSVEDWLADGKLESAILRINVDFTGALVSVEDDGSVRVNAQFFSFRIHQQRLNWLPGYDRPLFKEDAE